MKLLSRRGSGWRVRAPKETKAWLLVLAVAVLLAACGGDSAREVAETLELNSPAFGRGDAIPRKHTCDGADHPPPLRWSSEAPTEEFVVTVTDPTADGFVHWVVWGIPGSVTALQEELPEGAVQGENDFGETGYRGPCPPPEDRWHTYEFTVYAVTAADTTQLDEGATLDEVFDTIDCCIETKGTLTGIYER